MANQTRKIKTSTTLHAATISTKTNYEWIFIMMHLKLTKILQGGYKIKGDFGRLFHKPYFCKESYKPTLHSTTKSNRVQRINLNLKLLYLV